MLVSLASRTPLPLLRSAALSLCPFLLVRASLPPDLTRAYSQLLKKRLDKDMDMALLKVEMGRLKEVFNEASSSASKSGGGGRRRERLPPPSQLNP
ncbi:hypothetical protein RHGRI_023745 [Rhododendron griersonianum]|uniref:Uncharacterized protein n=1 Tax=Rhododendron griersonianum TaxID=479676 RepID=A0AAV6J9Z0_9ERIC|nr:hypothetical protein RHGRI_023745 [Rhododendron griersonianum]